MSRKTATTDSSQVLSELALHAVGTYLLAAGDQRIHPLRALDVLLTVALMMMLRRRGPYAGMQRVCRLAAAASDQAAAGQVPGAPITTPH